MPGIEMDHSSPAFPRSVYHQWNGRLEGLKERLKWLTVEVGAASLKLEPGELGVMFSRSSSIQIVDALKAG